MNVYKDSTKVVFKMSIPIFIELLLQLLVGNIDQFMVSQYSQASVAAIGNSNQIMNILIIVLNVMSVASTVLVSQYIGANETNKVSETGNMALLIIFVSSILVSGILILLRLPLFSAMQVSPDIMSETCNYFAIVASFMFIQGLYMVFAAILRSYSMVKEVMITSVVMNTINIIGNAILINGLLGFPRMGILGAAISTNISKCIGLAIISIVFFKKTNIRISLKYFKPFPIKTMNKLLYIGIPSGGEELSYNLSQIIILSFVNLLGTAVVATRVFCNMMANVAYVYTIAISNATQIILGYLLGGQQTDKINKRVMYTIITSWIISLSITALLYFNSDTVLGIFSSDPKVLSLGKKILFIELFLEVGRTVNIVMTKSLIALGDVAFPVIIGILSGWIISVMGSYLLGIVLGYGLVGIWIAMAIDECFRGTVFLIHFYFGRWRLKIFS